jgi:HlyD family secretion protein
VTLQDPPEDLRPGLSATAKVTTATRGNALTVPIQALTVRRQADLISKDEKGSVQAAAPEASKDKEKEKDNQEIQGVFVLRNHKAEFVPVDTGIAGTTDIEVIKGLKEGDEIITGSYKVLRTLRPGTSIKVDNAAPKKEEESS